MALSNDQRAILELLLEQRQSYADISETLGVEEAEVRSRAGSAVASLGAELIATDGGAMDLMLGQLDEADARAARDRIAADRELLAEARRLAALLRLALPAAEVPELPREPASGPPPEPRAEPPPEPRTEPPRETEIGPPGSPRIVGEEDTAAVGSAPGAGARKSRPEEAPQQAGPSLERGQKRLLAVLLGGAFVVAAIVVGLSGSLGGGDAPESEEPPAAESAGTEEGSAAGDDGLIRADLTAQGGGSAQGAAIFGSVEDSPVLQVTARGLEPTSEGERYHVWLYSDEDFALRVAGVPVGRDGTLATQFELPIEVLQFVVDGRFQQVDISRASERAVQREERRSLRERRAPRYVGESVLRGPITGPGIDDPGSGG